MQDTSGFLLGFSKSIIQGLSEIKKFEIDAISEGVEKSCKHLFTMGISIALIGTGFFIIMWGLATAIDTLFAMRGMGYVLIGVVAALIGALVYKK